MAKIKDPHAKREAQKYDNPIPSREFILDLISREAKPLSYNQIAEFLQLETEDHFEALRRRLKAMVRDEQVERLRKGKFWPVGKRELKKGKLLIDDSNKVWVVPERGGKRILIKKNHGFKFFNGSKVVVSIPSIKNSERNYLEGRLVEILDDKEPQLVVGRFESDGGSNFVIPQGKDSNGSDIVIPKGKEKTAKHGHIVSVSIDIAASSRGHKVGKVVEVLGSEKEKGIEVEAALRAYGIPHTWPKEVLQDSKKYSQDSIAKEKSKRVDLTELPLVTIDGEDSRDFDDAVFCEPNRGGGFRLYVAIADVGYYVKSKSSLDVEAKNRGNSVYFPNYVVPMLPEVLSNGLCSLNPEVERLCMVCEMCISKSGKLTKYEFYEGVMRSHARLTYTEVAKILAGDSFYLEKYSHVVEDLENLHAMYKVLKQERDVRGAIDFETVETIIKFGKKGKISSIVPIERNVAHRIIEESMLLANVSTAKFLLKHKIPGLYRVHESPPTEKIDDLRKFLGELGLKLGGKKNQKPEPIDYGTLLSKIKDREDQSIIQTVLLRSLSQAVYSPDNIGHFGLAYSAYSHFTSPIRRYPDLLVHRQIKKILSGKWDLKKHKAEIKAKQAKDGKSNKKTEDEVFQELAHHCSVTERRADDATRDVVLSLKCQYISNHLGDVFEGVISGVTRFGFFVELTDIYVDGLIHMQQLADDYYIYDQVHHRLYGERGGRVYSLGQKVTVRVARVNVDERKIDFELVESQKQQSKARNKKSYKPSSKVADKKLKTKKDKKKLKKSKRNKR